MGGRIIGIARRSAPRASMETLVSARIGLDFGVERDWRGRRQPGKRNLRQVTILTREGWEEALAALDGHPPVIDWTARRANLLVENVQLSCCVGQTIMVGDAELEITGETDPCQRMDEVFPGLKAALTPGWRGGVTCVVVRGGSVALGDAVVFKARTE